MILDYLLEEFFTADHYKTNYYDGFAEIFKNPTPREIRDIARAEDNNQQAVRLGLDQEGNIFAWHSDILHDEMEKILDRKFLLRFEYNYPEKHVWLGSGTMQGVWDKFGTPNVIERFKRIIPGLTAIKNSGARPGNAWDAETEKNSELEK